MDKTYNIFADLRGNIEDFDQKGVYIVGKPDDRDQFEQNVERRGMYGGYYFSQRRMLETIDLACASKYRTGEYDSEGKRKTYLNIVNFHKDVAINQIDVNVTNYTLQPTNSDFIWPVSLMDKRFKEWAEEKSYDDQIDEFRDDFVRCGTCVSKKIKGGTERVPLRSLRVTQTAKSLYDAASNGGYVIIENQMSYTKMKQYPKWKLQDLKKNKNYIVFERYSLIPRAILMQFNDENVKPNEEDWDDMVLCQQILIPHVETLKKYSNPEDMKGRIAWMAEIDNDRESFTLEEAHYEKVDGRWLGKGEVEKQLENQIARNLTANLRQRALQWAARKIFQSSDDEVKKNLLMEVKDGDVLEVKQNGNITQVNTQTQQLSDFQAQENMIKENSNQISFSFEVASGDTLPSSTPFRLGVLLQAAVSKYFKRKQDTLSNFLKRSFFHQIIPLFKKENKDSHTIVYSISSDNYDQARDAMAIVHANDMLKKEWMKSNFISREQAMQRVAEDMNRHPYLFIEIPDNFYEEPECYIKLNINEPINADVESLTTLYTTLAQKGDPRAENVLKAIFAKKGQNIAEIMGSAPQQQSAPNGSVPSNVQQTETPVATA